MYRLKHNPTGLYYQPHKHRGSNLSIRGKIYQTNTHGLSSAFKYKERYPEKNLFTVFVEKDSNMHKKTKDILVFTECRYSHNQLKADTLLSDWTLEKI